MLIQNDDAINSRDNLSRLNISYAMTLEIVIYDLYEVSAHSVLVFTNFTAFKLKPRNISLIDYP